MEHVSAVSRTKQCEQPLDNRGHLYWYLACRLEGLSIPTVLGQMVTSALTAAYLVRALFR